jgi:hypothetical protein
MLLQTLTDGNVEASMQAMTHHFDEAIEAITRS